MKTDEFLDILSDMDDELIIEAKRNKISHKKYFALAACLCLVLAGAVALFHPNGASIVENIPSVPTILDVGTTKNEATLSLNASDAASVFDNDNRKDATNRYTVVYAVDKGFCNASGIPETLGVYKPNPTKADESKAKAFYASHADAMRALIGMNSIDAEWDTTTDPKGDELISAFSFEADKSSDNFCLLSLNLLAGENALSIKASSTLPIKISGDELFLPGDANDELIKSIVTDLSYYFNSLFGTSYQNIFISKDYSYQGLKNVTVYLYDEECTIPLFSDKPLCGGYIALYFYTDWGEGTAHSLGKGDSRAYLCDIELNEAVLTWDSYYSLEGYAETIGLSDAEEHLTNGYVFGGHSCPLCMAEQDAVDLSDYDTVSLEYVGTADKGYVPFYAFYKNIGENSYGFTQYAKTYVCALKLSGVEQFFASAESNHISSSFLKNDLQ